MPLGLRGNQHVLDASDGLWWLCVVGLFGGLLCSGCTRPDTRQGYESPAAVAVAMAQAVTAQDRGRLRSVFPTDTLLSEALECSGPDNQLTRAQRERESFLRELDDDLAQVSMQYVATKQRKKLNIAKDTQKNGCRAKMDMQLRRVQVKMQVTSEGQTNEVKESLTVVRFGKRGWFLVDH